MDPLGDRVGDDVVRLEKLPLLFNPKLRVGLKAGFRAAGFWFMRFSFEGLGHRAESREVRAFLWVRFLPS